MISAYPSIFQLGHRAIKDIFTTEVTVEEKIDGSQFSFKKVSDTEWEAKSKSCTLGGDIPKLFAPAVATMVELLPRLKTGWTYRGEAICKPKHNCLAYERAPKGGLILFDVDDGLENYLTRTEKSEESERLGLEIVPLLYRGTIQNPDAFKTFLDFESVLGGVKIEGFVVKNYSLFGIDKKVLMGKYVSEAFKEKHRTDWKADHPSRDDIITELGKAFAHEGRWKKAIQHLQEQGLLKGEPADIGPLMREIAVDIEKEEVDEIKEKLWQWARKKILAGAQKGFPEYYKKYLAEGMFDIPF